MKDEFRKRVIDLINEAAAFLEPLSLIHVGRPGSPIPFRPAAWLASAIQAVDALAASRSWYRDEIEVAKRHPVVNERVILAAALLRNLLRDIDSGLLATVEDRVRLEVFESNLDLAEYQLESGNTQLAGAVVALVLEDTMARACVKIQVEAEELEPRINALKAHGALTKSEAAIAKGVAALRNQAFHADWSFDEKVVHSCLVSTRTLVSKLLSE